MDSELAYLLANNAQQLYNLKQVPTGRIYATATTSVATSATLITLGSTTGTGYYLNGGMTTGSNGLIVPVTGYYQVNGGMQINPAVSGAQVQLYIYTGTGTTSGTANAYSGAIAHTGATTSIAVQVSDVIYVTSGTYISLWAASTTAHANTASAVLTYLSAALISQ